MTDSRVLFELIHSMSQNEKGYFKRYAKGVSSGRGDNYLLLFKAIDSQKNFNEARLRKKLSEVSFLPYLSREKNYLYHFIMKSLGAFHFESDREIRVNGMFTAVRILFNRGLLDHCLRKLNTIRKLIDANKLTAHRQELLRWENKLALARADIATIRKNRKKRDENTRKLENYEAYVQLYADLYAGIMQSGAEIPKSGHTKFRKYLSVSLLQNEDRAQTVQAKLYFNHIHSVVQDILGDQQRALSYSTRRLQLLEEYPECLASDPQQYINAMNNHIEILLVLGQFEKALKYCDKLRETEAGSYYLEARRFARVSILEQMIRLRQKDHVGNTAIVKKVEEGLWRFGDLVRIDERIQLCFFMSYSYFRQQKFHEALKWVGKVLNISTDLKEDFQIAARLLNLVIHYELGNLDHLASVLNSSAHFISKKERSFRYEKVFISFIRNKLLNTFDRKGLLEAFISLQNELEIIARNPSEKKALEYFDFLSWVGDKVQGYER